MADRRALSFDTWDQVLTDLHELETQGYDAVGKWNLEQTCKHLNDWLRFPIDGFPHQPLPIKWLLAIMKYTVGKRLFRKILTTGKMAAGGSTIPETVHKSDGNDSAALRQLEATITRFRNFKGELQPSPLFGNMSHAEGQQLQLIHFAHHLSFLVPHEKKS